MRHLFTILLLAGSSFCYGQFTRDTEPTAPLMVSAATAQSYFAQLDSAQMDEKIFIRDSKTAKACRKDQNCRGPEKCSHEVAEVTRRKRSRSTAGYSVRCVTDQMD
jgi:hypothetical protein